MKKKIHITAAILAISFIILGLSCYGYLKSNHAKNLIIQKINDAIPGTLSAESMDVSIFSFFINLKNVQLKDRQQNICFKFEGLFVDVSVASLFKKVVEVSLISLNKPVLTIMRDSNGRINLLDALVGDNTEVTESEPNAQNGNTPPVNIVINKARITDGIVSFKDPGTQVQINTFAVELEHFDLMAQKLSLTTQFSSSIVKIKDREITIDDFHLSSHIADGTRGDFEFEFHSDICEMSVRGDAENIKKMPQIDLNIDMKSDLESLNPFLGDKLALGGLAKITLSGKGSVNNPDIRMNLDVDNLKINDDVKNDFVTLSAKLHDRIFLIEKGFFNILGNKISIKGSTDFTQVFPKGFVPLDQPNLDLLKYDFAFSQTNQDLKKLEKWLTGISGKSTFSGSIKGRGINPETLTANLNTTLDLKSFKQALVETDSIDANAELNAGIEGGLMEIQSFNAETNEAQVSVSGQYNVVEKFMDMSLSIASSDLGATTKPLGIEGVNGNISSNLSVKGSLANPDIKAMVSGENLMAQGLTINDLKFEGFLDRAGRFGIQKLIIREPHLNLEASGVAHVFEKDFKLKDKVEAKLLISGTDINPGQFLESANFDVNTKQLDSLINFNLDVEADYAMDTVIEKINFLDLEIPIKQISANIDLTKKDVRVNLDKIASLKALFYPEAKSYDAGIVMGHSDFTPLLQSAGIQGVRLRVDGQINTSGKLPVEIPQDVLADITSARGHITLDAILKGRFREPDFAVDMTLTELAYNLNQAGIHVSEVNGKLTASPEKIRVIGLKSKINDGYIDVDGRLDLKDYRVQKSELSLVADNIHIPMASSPSNDIRQVSIDKIESQLSLNLDYETIGNIDMETIYIKDFPLNTLEAIIDLSHVSFAFVLDKSILMNASFNPGNEKFKLDVNIDDTPLEPVFEYAGLTGVTGQLKGHVISHGKLAGILPEQALDNIKQGSGKIQIAIDVQGSVREPELRASLDLEAINYDIARAGVHIFDLNGNITAGKEKVAINGITAKINDGDFKLGGFIELADLKVDTCQLNLTASNIDIPLPSASGGNDSIYLDHLESDLDIRLQHGIQTASSMSKPSEKKLPLKTLLADLDLSRLNLSMKMDQTTLLQASIDPEKLTYGLDLTFNKTQLADWIDIIGQGHLNGTVNGHLKSAGKVNMVLPAGLADGLKHAGGKINCRADVTGTFDQPDFRVAVNLADINYPIPQAGLDISNLSGKINASDQALIVDNITAALGQGHLSLNGNIGLKDFKPIHGEFRFKGDQIAIEIPDMAHIEFSSDLKFSGTSEKSDLSGSLLLTKGEYIKDFIFDLSGASGGTKQKKTPSNNKAGTGIPMVDNMALNIDIDYKDPFTVDNNLAFILIEPDVNLSGTTTNPVVTGRAKIVEGTIIYQQKEFEIETGIIDFVDPYKIDPEIQLTAKTDIRDWVINLQISGKTDNLKLQLFSQPEETHEDILSLLVAGKTTKELRKGGSDSYTDVLAGQASDIIGQNVEDSTPLDSFKVGYDGNESQGSNVSVTMGKKLSRRLEVIYSMKTEDEETVHTNAAEYKLLEHIMVKAFNDSKGDFGTEFTFKLEFR